MAAPLSKAGGVSFNRELGVIKGIDYRMQVSGECTLHYGVQWEQTVRDGETDKVPSTIHSYKRNLESH